ncbi:HEAT repeat domain-containing protein [Desulfovibrio sp. OttesenSCG-928-O18]|nr:HEAT repeat domain-containing protein [Desulfovibrio sp. OttesenSCG-928-O18]
MPSFRTRKRDLATLLLPPAWPENAAAVPEAAAAIAGMEAVSPLLALLPRGGLLKWRAVIALGRVVAGLAASNMEEARTVMRRCMWHMNEDSGNMGWGVAEAMGEILAASPALAAGYGKVVLSYLRNTGFADNYIDHAVLRRGAYWAVGRFAPLYGEFRPEATELLEQGLADEDAQSRGIAAWGVGKLAAHGCLFGAPDRLRLAALLRRVEKDQEDCDVLEGLHRCVEPAAAFARHVLHRLNEPYAE